MKAESLQEQGYQADVFSRASLLMTFDLLRKNRPELALHVRNIVAGEPLPPERHDELGDINGDRFRVAMEPTQIREVIHGLMEFTAPEAVDLRNPEMNIMARALMQDWLLLAHRSSAFTPIIDSTVDTDEVDSNSEEPDIPS